MAYESSEGCFVCENEKAARKASWNHKSRRWADFNIPPEDMTPTAQAFIDREQEEFYASMVDGLDSAKEGEEVANHEGEKDSPE